VERVGHETSGRQPRIAARVTILQWATKAWAVDATKRGTKSMLS